MKTSSLFLSSLVAAAAMSSIPAFADTTGSTDSIWINFDSGEGTGAEGYTGTWNDTGSGESGTVESLKYSDTAGTASGASLTYTSPNTWSFPNSKVSGTVNDGVLKGYLDDGTKGSITGVTISVSNISYLVYDVTILVATDTANKQFTAKTLNGQTYTSDGNGNGILGSGSWGASHQASINNDNSFTVSGLTGDLSLSSTGSNTSSARGCIAGLIITNSGGTAVNSTISDDFATWASDSLAGTGWTNATTDSRYLANITLGSSVALNVTGTDITTTAIIASGDSKTLTLSGNAVSLIGPGVVRTDSTTANIVINNTLNFANGGKISGNVTTGDSGLLHVSGGELDAAASAAASLNVSIDSGATYALSGVGTTAVSAKVSGEGTVAVVGGVSDFTGGGDKSYITLNNVSDTSSFTGTVELRNVQAVVSGSGASSFANASKVVLNSAALHFINDAATFSKDIEIGSGQNGYIRSYGNNKIASGAGATIAGNVSGEGTLTSSDDGDVTFTGTVDIGAYVANKSGGISVFSGDSTTIGTLTMNSGTTVNFTGTNTITTANLTGGTLSGGNITTANVTSGMVAVSGSTIGTLSQTAGTLNFTGTNTITTANLTGGTLSGGNITTANVTSGTVAISGSTIGTLSQTAGTLNFTGTGTTTVGTFSTAKGDDKTLSIAGETTVSATGFTNGWGLVSLTVDGNLNVSETFQYGSGNVENAITGSGTISAKTFDFGNVGTYNVSGVTLEVGSGGITHTNAWGYKLNLGATTIKATSDFTIAGNTGGIGTGSTSLTDTETGTTFDTNGHTITVNSALGGSGKLVKAGEGTLALKNSNTTVNVALSAGHLEVVGATVNVVSAESSSSNITFNGAGGTVVFKGTTADDTTAKSYSVGTIEMTSSDNYGRNVTIESGATVSASTFNNAWGMNTLTVDGALNVSGKFSFATGGNNSQENNIITGGGTISAKTLVLGNVGTYTISVDRLEVGSGGIENTTNGSGTKIYLGKTTIAATESWANTVAASHSFALDSADGTTFEMQSSGGSATSATFASVFSGSGKLIKTGAGTLTLSGANTFSGGVSVEKGTLVANNNSALGAAAGSVKIAGGQLEIGSGIKLAQTNITIALSDAYSSVAAILGEGALASGTTITLTKAEEAVIDSLVKQTKEYQIFANGSSLASDFSVESFTLDKEAWANWKISGYDAESGKVTLEMIPEPSAFGLLAGVGALVFVAARRRRRAK